MATLALAANIAMIGGHFAEMVQVFVYPLITHIRNRIRPRAGEELERCQQNLRGTLDFLEEMTQEGMHSEKDCEYMAKLAREHGVLDQETLDLSGTIQKKGLHREDGTCFKTTVGSLAHKVKLFQLKVQMFSSERRRGRIVCLMQVPSRFPTTEDPEIGLLSSEASLPPHTTSSLPDSSNLSSAITHVQAEPQVKSCPDDAASPCASPEAPDGLPSISGKFEGEPGVLNAETIKLSAFTGIKEYIRLQVGTRDTKSEV